MSQKFLYFVGGPQDLTKKAVPEHALRGAVYVMDEWQPGKTGEAVIVHHPYQLRRVGQDTWVGVHPTVYGGCV